MAKILITGAGGYIGSVSAHEFLNKGHNLVLVDNLSTGFRKPLEVLQEKFGRDRVSIYEIDLKEIEKVFIEEKEIEAVVHFAANCSVNESMNDPQKYFSNNTFTSNHLFTKMLENNIKKLVFSSTCAVYGEAQSMPIDENHPTNPTNPYGESKLLTEKIINWYSQLKGLNFVILRYFNVCGATDNGEIGDSKKPSVHLMQNAVRGALEIEPFYLTCPEVDTPDKTPIRDYVNVVDLANAHIKAFDYLSDGGKSEIINLGTGDGNSVLEIVKKVEEITGAKLPLEKTEARKGEYAKMVASISKAKSILNWEPMHSIEDSVKSLVDWYTRHPKGWEY